MAYDSLTLKILVNEINQIIINGKITKIVQPERDEIVLNIFSNGNHKLVLSANPSINRLHFTTYIKENPTLAPNFCMLLRKHLTNAIVSNIAQMPFERVIDMTLIGKSELGYPETKHLVFELTGKTANIILTDEAYKIFDSLKHLPIDLDSNRIILAGSKYEFFPSRNKLTIDEIDKIKELLYSTTLPLRKVLLDTLLGVSVSTIAEMTANIDENNHSELNISRILDGINRYKDNLNNPNPNIVFVGNVPSEVYPFDYQSVKGDKRFYDTLNIAHDEYYYLKDRALRTSQKTKHLSTIIKNAINRIEKKISIQTQAILDSQDNDTYKKYGDLILGNLHLIKRNDESVNVIDYYDENCPTITIPLDKTMTPQKNAQEYYRKYHKAKNTILFTEKLLQENKQQLEYVLGVQQFLKFSTTENDLHEITNELTQAGLIKEKSTNTKAKQPNITTLRYVIDGFNVFVGKNNVQNEYLTHRQAKPNDMWLHTQSIHSSHVIIESNGKQIPDDVIVIASEITAYFSQARNSGKTAVDYTLKKNIKKPPSSAMGFVIYNTYNTIIVQPSEHLELLKK